MASARPQPLRIYLDSSDFTDRPSPELAQVRASLAEYQAKGVIELWFSGLHVREATHLDPAAKFHAVGRAKVIKELCRRNALLSLDRLFPLEAVAAIRGGTEVPEAYAANGDWLTRELDSFARRLGLAMVRGLRNRIDRATGDALRHQPVHAYLATREARLSDLTLRTAERNFEEFSRDWRDRFHLTPRFWQKQLPLRVLRGQLTLEQLQQECVEGIADVENFIGHWVDEAPHLDGWAKELREGSTDGGELILELRQTAESYDDLAQKIAPLVGEKKRSIRRDLNQVAAPDLGAARRGQLNELIDDNEEWLAEQGIARSRAEAELPASPVGALPAFDTLLRAVAGYFASNVRTERKLAQSDLGDLLHSAYIPYVDLFRCDQYNAERFAALAAPHGTEVISPATKLPEAIQRAAAKRGLI